MSMLFDQETVTKIREYNIAKQARGEGREDGMKATISILQDMSLDKTCKTCQEMTRAQSRKISKNNPSKISIAKQAILFRRPWKWIENSVYDALQLL